MNNLTDFTRLTLIGLRTKFEFDKKEMTWTLTGAESNVTSISRSPQTSFTLGKHNWTIKGDTGCSEDGAEFTAELKMSGSQEDLGFGKRLLPECPSNHVKKQKG